MDKLDRMFELQESLNRKIGSHRDPGIPDTDKAEWILNYARAMSQEIAELTDSVPWKWWARYQRFDSQNAAVELIDILHFWISACQVMGLSPDDVFTLYTQKHEVNRNRQQKGYTRKDPSDCGHISS